jgi:hypothetical protein
MKKGDSVLIHAVSYMFRSSLYGANKKGASGVGVAAIQLACMPLASAHPGRS